MAGDIHATAAARLKDVEQRYTPARQSLVELLGRAGRPLSTPEIVDSADHLAQSSVYRNLAVLEGAGVVSRVVAVDEFARYELAEGLTQHHHHLLCLACGGVTDFTVPSSVERTMSAAIEAAAASADFRALGHRLDLVGVCARCQVGDVH